MKNYLALSLLLLSQNVGGFTSPSVVLKTNKRNHVKTTTTTSLNAALSEGDQVMFIGPGFLQLVAAKTAKAAGLRPIIVAPQKKLDSFQSLVLDDDIMKDGTIGMPEIGEPQFGNIAAIIFCSEDAILPKEYIARVLDYNDKGQSAFVDGALKKVILCAPVVGSTKEKGVNWIPILNNDGNKDKIWTEFVQAFEKHSSYKDKDGVGSIIRFGSLFGGSVDGPEFLKELGIAEKMYKMSLEQYRDLKERGFDRYKLGAQVLEGNVINKIPPNQEKMEKQAMNEETRETFRVVSNYPEQDRSNRHTVAQAIVQCLLRDDDAYPKEITVLSKATSSIPTETEWTQLFSEPGPANWPDPFSFDITQVTSPAGSPPKEQVEK